MLEKLPRDRVEAFCEDVVLIEDEYLSMCCRDDRLRLLNTTMELACNNVDEVASKIESVGHNFECYTCPQECEELRGNGICDEQCAYIYECGWDGGDCQGHPDDISDCDCMVGWPGDNACDAMCMTFGCNFDGGDCEVCDAVLCPADNLGNGICDDRCNNQACEYDMGDCSMSGSPEECDRTLCPEYMVGNMICDEDCNNPQCAFDEGDCGAPYNNDDLYFLTLKYEMEFDNEVLIRPVMIRTLHEHLSSAGEIPLGSIALHQEWNVSSIFQMHMGNPYDFWDMSGIMQEEIALELNIAPHLVLVHYDSDNDQANEYYQPIQIDLLVIGAAEADRVSEGLVTAFDAQQFGERMTDLLNARGFDVSYSGEGLSAGPSLRAWLVAIVEGSNDELVNLSMNAQPVALVAFESFPDVHPTLTEHYILDSSAMDFPPVHPGYDHDDYGDDDHHYHHDDEAVTVEVVLEGVFDDVSQEVLNVAREQIAQDAGVSPLQVTVEPVYNVEAVMSMVFPLYEFDIIIKPFIQNSILDRTGICCHENVEVTLVDGSRRRQSRHLSQTASYDVSVVLTGAETYDEAEHLTTELSRSMSGSFAEDLVDDLAQANVEVQVMDIQAPLLVVSLEAAVYDENAAAVLSDGNLGDSLTDAWRDNGLDDISAGAFEIIEDEEDTEPFAPYPYTETGSLCEAWCDENCADFVHECSESDFECECKVTGAFIGVVAAGAAFVLFLFITFFCCCCSCCPWYNCCRGRQQTAQQKPPVVVMNQAPATAGYGQPAQVQQQQFPQAQAYPQAYPQAQPFPQPYPQAQPYPQYASDPSYPPPPPYTPAPDAAPKYPE